MEILIIETNRRARELLANCKKSLPFFARLRLTWSFYRRQEAWEALLPSRNSTNRVMALVWFLVNQEHVSPNDALQAKLANTAREGSLEERQLACAMLWNIYNLNEATVAGLISALEDPDSLVRDIAACAIAKNGTMAVAMLVAILLGKFDGRNRGVPPSVELRRSALPVLISTVEEWNSTFRFMLKENLRDDEDARAMQDEYWRPLQDHMRECLSELSPLLEDGPNDLQADVAYCMALLGAKRDQAINALIRATRKCPSVELLQRWNSVENINGNQATAAIFALRQCMSHPESELSELAAEAIARMGKHALPALMECLRDEHPRTRATAASVLARRMGFPSNLFLKCRLALPILRELLSDEDSNVRTAAAESLRIAELYPQDEMD